MLRSSLKTLYRGREFFMKKTALLTATILTVTCLGGNTLSANAASNQFSQITKNGNKIIFSYGSNCGNSTLLEQIKDCLQNIIPNCPGTGTPDTDTPDNSQPDNDKPDNDKPDNSQPDNDKPDNSQPDNDKPDNSQPDNDKPDDTVEEETAHPYINKIVSLVNAERAMAGLAPLTIDKNLQAAAQVRAIEIETSFSHTRPNGTSFATAIKEQNISYRNAGENIAWGQRSPEEVVSAWMNSDGHRANIMNAKFTKIGVGYQQNSRGVNYWSQLFTN